MSDTQLSRGWMVPIAPNSAQYTDAEWYDIEEKMWEENDRPFFVNYERTLIYTDSRDDNIYGLALGNLEKPDTDIIELKADAEEYGLILYLQFAVPYSCVWYNGVDSDMSQLKLKEFCEQTGVDYETWFGEKEHV